MDSLWLKEDEEESKQKQGSSSLSAQLRLNCLFIFYLLELLTPGNACKDSKTEAEYLHFLVRKSTKPIPTASPPTGIWEVSTRLIKTSSRIPHTHSNLGTIFSAGVFSPAAEAEVCSEFKRSLALNSNQKAAVTMLLCVCGPPLTQMLVISESSLEYGRCN